MHVSFIVVTMNSRDRHEIIGLCKISYFIKQLCCSICLEKSVSNASKLLKNGVSRLNNAENRIF